MNLDMLAHQHRLHFAVVLDLLFFVIIWVILNLIVNLIFREKVNQWRVKIDVNIFDILSLEEYLNARNFLKLTAIFIEGKCLVQSSFIFNSAKIEIVGIFVKLYFHDLSGSGYWSNVMDDKLFMNVLIF